MKNIARLIIVLFGVVTVLTVFQNCGDSSHQDLSSELESLDTLKDKAMSIRLAHCASCHDGAGAIAEPSQILNDRYLIDNRWIVPGDPSGSALYMSLFANMPKDQPPLSDQKIGVIERWILALALEGRALAKIEVSDAPDYNFGSVISGQTSEHAFTLTNTGDITAIGLAGSGLAAPFRFKGGAFPGTGATCLPVLAGKTACTVIIEYAPSSPGSHSDTVEFAYNDGVSVRQVTRALSGSSTGITLASLQMSDTPAYSFGIVNAGTGVDKSFVITNTGAAAASGLTGSGPVAPFSFKGGSYPGTGGTCGATLAAGANCSIVVRYAPTANGIHAGNVQVAYNTGAGTASVSSNLSGEGVGGSGTPVYYSEVRGILNSACLTCHNSGADSWGSTYASLLAFKASTQATPAIVPGNVAGSRLTGRVSGVVGGKPQMGTGAYGSLSAPARQKILDWIANGAPDDPASSPANLIVDSGPTHNFGSLASGSTLDKSFTVVNSGGTVASEIAGAGLAAPYSFKGGTFPGTGGTCGISLAASGSCTFVVTFAPTAAGTFNDTIEINYKSSTTVKQATRAVTGLGTGLALANLTLSDSPSYNFGTVGVTSPVDKTFTINNIGNRQATALNGSGLAAPFSFRGGSYPGTGGTCGATLNQSASCTVVVRYAPTTNGAHTSALNIGYNNGSAARTVSSALSGTGSGAGTPVYYSEVRAILNSSCTGCHGSAPNSWGSTYASLIAFKADGKPTAAIVPGNVATSRFAQRISGVHMGQPQMGVSPYGNLSLANRQKILNWIAQGALNDPAGTPANLTINGGPTYAFGNVVSGSTLDHTFTVTNSGQTTATDLAGAGLAAPFRFKGTAFPGTGGTCTTSLLGNNATCTIVVTFAPTSAATFNDTIELNYKSGTTVKQATRAVSGVGTGVPLAILAISNGPTYDFGLKNVASVNEMTFTVSNTGSRSAVTMSGSGLALPFRFKGGTYPGTGGTCGATLAQGATCVVKVTFTPTVAGLVTSTLTMNYNNGASAQTVSIAVRGTGVATTIPVYYSQVRAILTTSCGSCHNADWGTSYASLMAFKRPSTQATNAIIASNLNSRFVKRITGTELGVQMGTGANGNLSASDRATILAWIAQGAPNDPAGTITQDHRSLNGDRYYIGSVLHKVYGFGGGVNSLTQPLYTRADLFGSNCVHQDFNASRRKTLPMTGVEDTCFGVNSEDARLEAETTPATSTIGESVRLTACMRIADNMTYTQTALTRAGLTITSPINDTNVKTLYQRFYPGIDPSVNLLEDIREIGEQAVARPAVVATPGKTKLLEGWRYMTLAVCMSPGWQAP